MKHSGDERFAPIIDESIKTLLRPSKDHSGGNEIPQAIKGSLQESMKHSEDQ